MKQLSVLILALLTTQVYGRCDILSEQYFLNRFVGEHQTSSGDFKYSAKRKEISYGVLEGQFEEQGEITRFNLSFGQTNVLVLHNLKNKLTYYADGCGETYDNLRVFAFSADEFSDLTTLTKHWISIGVHEESKEMVFMSTGGVSVINYHSNTALQGVSTIHIFKEGTSLNDFNDQRSKLFESL